MQIVWAGNANPVINAGIGRFVASHIEGCEAGFGEHTSMGVIHEDKLIAGVVYHNWNPRSHVIELSSASTSKLWLTRPVLQAMFSYPFDQVSCQMVVLRVSERNTAMLRIAKAYGFKSVIIPRLRGRDENEHILTLTDDDWRSSRFHSHKD